MKFEKNVEILRTYFKTTNAGLEKILGLSNGYIANIGKKETDNPGKLLVGLVGQGISSDWFLTGEGDMFLARPKERPLQVEIPSLGAQIDQRLEKLEAQIAEIKGHLGGKGMDGPDSGMFTSEPEPEYAESPEHIAFVEGVAAGRPIYQSDVRTTIPVPKRYIKTKLEDYFVGRINGTSMANAGIPDGCLVLFRISDVPRDGGIQIVEWQGEATLKRIREVPGKGWKICFDDGTGRHIDIAPGEEPRIQGDFIAVLPED
jgi:SOS-response transcriptional repressor LexA